VRPGLPREGQHPKGRHGAPGLTAALGKLRRGDTLVVWKLDRLGRSVQEVLTIADDLHARSIALRILTGRLAGSYSPAGEGKFFFTMMAAFAGLERDIIYKRTTADLAAAKAQGRTGGRPAVMDAGKLAAARTRQEPRQDHRGPRRQQRLSPPPSGR
jgi:DNA invertase Pin-like site-specific DNA recombinase